MSMFWKILIGLALAIPITAYVLGSLAGSSAQDPRPRDPVHISDVTESPRPGEQSNRPGAGDPDDGDDTDDDRDDNGARVVVPQPTRVDGDDARPEGNDDDSRGGDDSDDGGGDD